MFFVARHCNILPRRGEMEMIVNLAMLQVTDVQCESKKSPWVFLTLFLKQLGIFSPNLTRLLVVPICARQEIFIQLSATLTKWCHIQRGHPVHIICENVHHQLKCTLAFSDIFVKQLGIFSPNFTHLLRDHIYSRLQIFSYLHLWRSYAMLSATTQHAFQPMVDILSIWWWLCLIWQNFIKVAVNWIKLFFSPGIDKNV